MKDKEILLVEDNPDDAELTMRALKQNNVGNTVMGQRRRRGARLSVQRGAYASRAGQPSPVLVLLDLKLPKVDGLEVLRQMRADPRARLSPVVILTSSGEEHDIVQGYGLGANSYVRKPVDFAQFHEAMRQLGLYWLVLNQSPPH